MTATFFPSPLPVPDPTPAKKKRVLLIDTSSAKRDMRSEVMRKLGMEVDCAADIVEARCWWRADLYDLVLIDMAGALGQSQKFCEDIRGATPPQQLAFFVGAPDYLSASPNADAEILIENGNGEAEIAGLLATLPAVSRDLPQRWGILEASRRISAVRSASVARTRAIRERPAPPRDYEGRGSKRSMTSTLDDLLREEMQ